jgi:hypothetical protein
MNKNIDSPTFLRTGRDEAGRLYEIPLFFVGSTAAFVILLPRAMQSGHPWLSWLVLEAYVAILLFLFRVLRGWGRIAATVAINLGIVVWHWVPAQVHLPLMISAPIIFLVGWAVDFWLARRSSVSSPPVR